MRLWCAVRSLHATWTPATRTSRTERAELSHCQKLASCRQMQASDTLCVFGCFVGLVNNPLRWQEAVSKPSSGCAVAWLRCAYFSPPKILFFLTRGFAPPNSLLLSMLLQRSSTPNTLRRRRIRVWLVYDAERWKFCQKYADPAELKISVSEPFRVPWRGLTAKPLRHGFELRLF